MKRATPQIWDRLRAAGLLAVLLVGWLGAGVLPAVPPVESCTMGCVEAEDGAVCCCIADRAERRAELREEHAPSFAEVSSSCPSNCSTAPASSNLFSAAKAVAVWRGAALERSAGQSPPRQTSVPHSHTRTALHERAPPAPLATPAA